MKAAVVSDFTQPLSIENVAMPDCQLIAAGNGA
jgi:hypothetical protein